VPISDVNSHMGIGVGNVLGVKQVGGVTDKAVRLYLMKPGFFEWQTVGRRHRQPDGRTEGRTEAHSERGGHS